ncbi:hypothetical protein [Candidatus Reidiella endopervernicosa]|uniref:Uncharacterized protein n=1 Tax=Candidatus Reidiella endopervernicosa TaxID=2738883 RepID=A0A6N0HUB2_9GAMM|nr:hypothetical protein [Candidatus Reidiella endopervernicosa]QKQ25949.1 hypothetical protein HUE57_06370 [Candidatus Reidiella endopervernicosa]
MQKRHEVEITQSRDHMTRLVGEEQVISRLLELSLNEQDMHTYLNSILLALFESATWLKLQTKGVVFLRSRMKRCWSLWRGVMSVSSCAHAALTLR